MKKIIAIALLLSFTMLHADSGKVLKKQDFEEQVPGSVPAGWRHSWGKQGEDYFLISSEYASSGSRSIVLDRMNKESKAQWGFCAVFPHLDQGYINIMFKFLVVGPGNQACFTFEFRDKTARQRLFNLAFKDRKILLGSHAKGLSHKKRSILVSNYEPEQWYTAILTFPVSPKYGKYVTAEVYPVGSLEEKKTVRHLMTFPKGKFGIMMLCLAPNKNGYKLFIDDYIVKAYSSIK